MKNPRIRTIVVDESNVPDILPEWLRDEQRSEPSTEELRDIVLIGVCK